MSVKINKQQDYFETEATIDPLTDISEVHDLLRALKSNCRLLVIYSGGAVQAINVEQHTRIPAGKNATVRELIGIGTTES